MAKKHKWLVRELELQNDLEHFETKIMRALLVNTDRRRKVKYFAVSLALGEFTLESMADMLREGQELLKISEGRRPKKNKHPKPDERQMDLFGGNDVQKTVGENL